MIVAASVCSIDLIRRHALASLILPPRLHLSQWIEREIVLAEGKDWGWTRGAS